MEVAGTGRAGPRTWTKPLPPYPSRREARVRSQSQCLLARWNPRVPWPGQQRAARSPHPPTRPPPRAIYTHCLEWWAEGKPWRGPCRPQATTMAPLPLEQGCSPQPCLCLAPLLFPQPQIRGAQEKLRGDGAALSWPDRQGMRAWRYCPTR